MTRGTTFHAYVPIMLEPDHVSTMLSQVLFGEEFMVLDGTDDWLSIRLDTDDIEGWVMKQGIELKEIENEEEMKPVGPVSFVSLPSATILDLTLGQQWIIPAGAAWNSRDSHMLSWYGHNFERLSGEGFVTPGNKIDLLTIGKRLRSLPFIHGGRSGFGFDGPGLVQMLCRMRGNKIPRFAQQQAELGTTINFMYEVEEGDLAFFDNEENEITHVGMILDEGNILHCDSCVSIDRLDHHGIYSSEQKQYTQKLRVIKRI